MVKIFIKIIIFFLLSLLLLLWFIPIPLEDLEKNFLSPQLHDKNGNILATYLSKNSQWCFPLEDEFVIPEKLKRAILTYEDNYFYYHPGINIFSILYALKDNIKAGKVVRGGSTITMQVARLLNPQSRTYIHKFIECLKSFKLELLYSKEEILKLYLTYAPYGRNIVGIKAAGLKFFNRKLDKLTWSQAAFLAILPNNPANLYPSLQNKRKLISKRNNLLKKLKDKGYLDNITYYLSIKENIPSKINIIKNHAPHLARELLYHQKIIQDKKHYINTKPILDKHKNIVKTTLDLKLQNRINLIMKNYMNLMKGKGVNNSACLVAETASGKIRAYIGSPDFYDFKNQGQVDGVLSPRSSGSILKPFLYGLSFDDGIILPQTLIKDIPTFYQEFSPSNADYKFRGVVRADKSLIKSLNIPAVRLLYRYGVDNFHQFLKNIELVTIFRSAMEYGLPLILGGAEIRLWDAVRMYRALGNNGKFTNLSILEDEDREEEDNSSLISPGSCYLVLDILKDLKRFGTDFNWNFYQNNYPLAWKTGTSYGNKDAWAIGVSPKWTVGVWVGNFDGSSNPIIKGSQASGPLLFNIFNTLSKNPDSIWFSYNKKHFKQIPVWNNTGFFSGRDCADPVMALSPIDAPVLPICPFHREIYVTRDNKYRVNSSCWKGLDFKKIMTTVFPPDVSQYLRENSRLLSEFPPWHPSCNTKRSHKNIKIIYPQSGSIIGLPHDFNGSKQHVILKAASQSHNNIIYWYLNNKLIKYTTRQHKINIDLEKGFYKLEIIDKNGNTDKIFFRVISES